MDKPTQRYENFSWFIYEYNYDDKAVSFRLFAPCNSVSYLVVLFCKSLTIIIIIIIIIT